MTENDNKNAENNIVVIKFEHWANETNMKTLFSRFNQLECEIDEKERQIANNESYKNNITAMRTNFSQRIGSIFVDDVFIKTKWVKERFIPNAEEITQLADGFGDQLKSIIDTLKPLRIDNANFTPIKRINTAKKFPKKDEDGNVLKDEDGNTIYEKEKSKKGKVSLKINGNVKQYAEYPFHHRLFKIFFEELEASDYFKNSKDEINEIKELKEERAFIDNKLNELMESAA